jgi:hypothetical protein
MPSLSTRGTSSPYNTNTRSYLLFLLSLYIYMCVRSTSVQSGDEDDGVIGLQFVLDAVHQLPVRVRGGEINSVDEEYMSM